MLNRFLVKGALAATLGLSAMIAPAFGAVCASTTTCTFNLDTTAVGAFGAGPYGIVKLDLSGANINFTVDLADGLGFNLIDTGTHEAFTFNNTLTGAVTISNFSSSLYSQEAGAGPFSNPQFSDFSAAIKSSCTNGSGCGVNVLTFTVSRTGGFTDVNQLVALSTGSGTAAYFSADIANGAGATGTVGAVGPPSGVPEPSSYFLLVSGVAALGYFAERRRRAAL